MDCKREENSDTKYRFVAVKESYGKDGVKRECELTPFYDPEKKQIVYIPLHKK